MILSDATIKSYIESGKIKLIPGENETIETIEENIVCASFDLRLGNEFRLFPHQSSEVLNPFETDSQDITEKITVADNTEFIIEPGRFLLAATKEKIGLPDNIVARVEGRSSIARLGLLIHITAWFIDPWFWRDQPSTITLEICNINSVPIVIKPGMRICQIAFELMDQPAEIPYNVKKNAKYNGQQDPQTSRLHISW